MLVLYCHGGDRKPARKDLIASDDSESEAEEFHGDCKPARKDLIASDDSESEAEEFGGDRKPARKDLISSDDSESEAEEFHGDCKPARKDLIASDDSESEAEEFHGDRKRQRLGGLMDDREPLGHPANSIVLDDTDESPVRQRQRRGDPIDLDDTDTDEESDSDTDGHGGDALEDMDEATEVSGRRSQRVADQEHRLRQDIEILTAYYRNKNGDDCSENEFE